MADELQELIRGGAGVKRAVTMLLTASLPGDGAGERGGVEEATSEGMWTPVVGAVRRRRVDHK